MRNWLPSIAAAAILAVGIGHPSLAQNQGKPAATNHPLQAEARSEQKIQEISRELYQYAYPIVLMDVTMRQTSAVPNATAVTGRAPINQFAYFRTYPAADARDVVRFNFDTLYSFAWADLSKGPIILSVPDTGGRLYLVPSLDMWTDVFASVGSRTTGTAAGNFAYVPPGWQGDLPQGVVRIDTPTSMIWIMGRIQTNGPSDYDNVHKIQDRLKLTPLEQWGKSYAPPATSPVDASVDTKTPPLLEVNKLSDVELFTRFAELVQKFPPHPNDYPILFRMKAIGLEPGKSWDGGTLDAATLDAINAGAKDGLTDMIAGVKKMGTHVNGWNLAVDNMGTYGTSYRRRAVVALAGLGANPPEDAIYPTAFMDGDGKPLDGSNNYVPHFDKGKTPPADAFWSLSMYDDEGFQVPNPINRFVIGDRDKLKFNEDGSLDIYIQAGTPGADKESNWLPSPTSGAMGPTLRIYSPRSEALDGTWTPPPFKHGQ
jgi:hypothetical protein